MPRAAVPLEGGRSCHVCWHVLLISVCQIHSILTYARESTRTNSFRTYFRHVHRPLDILLRVVSSGLQILRAGIAVHMPIPNPTWCCTHQTSMKHKCSSEKEGRKIIYIRGHMLPTMHPASEVACISVESGCSAGRFTCLHATQCILHLCVHTCCTEFLTINTTTVMFVRLPVLFQ